MKIIFKTGYERDEVASEQPFSFGNSCSNTHNDCGIISPQGDNDTCRDCGVATKKNYLEILEFTHFVEFFSFNYVSDNHKEKELVRKVSVVVALDLGCGNTKNPENES